MGEIKYVPKLGGGTSSGVNSVTVTAPITNTGTSSDPNIGFSGTFPTIVSASGNITQTQLNGNQIYRVNIPVAGAVVGDIVSGEVFSTALSNSINSSGNGLRIYSYVPTNGTVRFTFKIDFFVTVPSNSTVSIQIIK